MKNSGKTQQMNPAVIAAALVIVAGAAWWGVLHKNSAVKVPVSQENSTGNPAENPTPQGGQQASVEPNIAPDPKELAANRGEIPGPTSPDFLAPTAEAKTFRVSGGGKTGPRITGGFLDPLQPAQGEPQTFSVSALDSAGVVSVEVELTAGETVRSYDLQLVRGTRAEGVWQATWTAPETGNGYSVRISATSPRGTTSLEMELR